MMWLVMVVCLMGCSWLMFLMMRVEVEMLLMWVFIVSNILYRLMIFGL